MTNVACVGEILPWPDFCVMPLSARDKHWCVHGIQ